MKLRSGMRLQTNETLYRMLHAPTPELRRWLGLMVGGYLAYYAVPTRAGDYVLRLLVPPVIDLELVL
jgi:hypothetical protein